MCLLAVEVSALTPLSPNSGQHQFSPNDIHTLLRDKVTRIEKVITKMKNKMHCTFIKFSTHSVKNCMEVSLENLYVYIGALKRVKQLGIRTSYIDPAEVLLNLVTSWKFFARSFFYSVLNEF